MMQGAFDKHQHVHFFIMPDVVANQCAVKATYEQTPFLMSSVFAHLQDIF